MSGRGSRARDWGLSFGDLAPGPTNTILDVPGLRVGHATVRSERTVTGVTAILPAQRELYREPATAAVFTGNGFGKAVGTTQLAELGRLETPLLLTGTLSTFAVADATVRWVLDRPGHEHVRSVNPVVAETNDGWWAATHHVGVVTSEHVRSALEGTATPATLEGCRGAGAGTVAFGFKSGIGSASRMVDVAGSPRTLGCLVQANHTGRLPGLRTASSTRSDGSIVVVLVTDAPFSSRQLGRLARRGVYALARTGADFAHGSGDYAFAVSTGDLGARPAETAIDACATAVQDVVDEAVWNALVAAEDTTVGSTTYRALRPSDLLPLAER